MKYKEDLKQNKNNRSFYEMQNYCPYGVVFCKQDYHLRINSYNKASQIRRHE